MIKKVLLTAGIMALLARSAEACAVCMGTADSNVAPAITASMMLLLVTIVCLASAFIAFTIYLARRDALPAQAQQN